MAPSTAQWIPNFQLGYPVQRRYPWRFTTLITLTLFTFLTVIFILVNIPLTAYDIVFTFSNDPNNTHSVPGPISGLLPASLRPHPGEFSPLILKIGDSFHSNFSLFNYEITDIGDISDFERDAGYVTTLDAERDSFGFSNNPLDTCDVHNVTLSVASGNRVNVHVDVACWSPAFFRLRAEIAHEALKAMKISVGATQTRYIRAMVDLVLTDLENAWASQNVTAANNQNRILKGAQISASPCCKCTSRFDETFFLDSTTAAYYMRAHPTCSQSVPAKLKDSYSFLTYDDNSTEIFRTFGDGLPDENGALQYLPSYNLSVPAQVSGTLHNAFQVVYNAVRADLGVIEKNSIFPNASTFNSTILGINTSGDSQLQVRPVSQMSAQGGNYDSLSDITSAQELTRQIFLFSAEIDEMQQQAYTAIQLVGTARVPRLNYVTPVFRRKSGSSAAVSVFVAMFAMVSACWKAWTLILVYLAGRTSGQGFEEHNLTCNTCGNPSVLTCERTDGIGHEYKVVSVSGIETPSQSPRRSIEMSSLHKET